jgi:hypothetical protein
MLSILKFVFFLHSILDHVNLEYLFLVPNKKLSGLISHEVYRTYVNFRCSIEFDWILKIWLNN